MAAIIVVSHLTTVTPLDLSSSSAAVCVAAALVMLQRLVAFDAASIWARCASLRLSHLSLLITNSKSVEG